jgi:hypothetical protein
MFVTITVVNYYQPQPLDWKPTLAENDKIPFGNYILRQMLPQLFHGHRVSTNFVTPYEWETKTTDSLQNIIFVTTELNKMDSLSWDVLQNMVENGSSIFIATNTLPSYIAKSLKTKIESTYTINDSIGGNSLVARPFSAAKKYQFNKIGLQNYFTSYDTLNTKVLGHDAADSINFISIQWGEGQILLHSSPLVFTNFGMLHQQNHQYIAHCLSYLPNRNTLWDEAYHPYSEANSSLLRVIFNNRALNAAWQMLLAMTILMVFLYNRRRQRAIPVVKPPQNTSLAFAYTIARLYQNRANHHDAGLKRIQYFNDKLRTQYGISITTFSAEEIAKAATKTGVEPKYFQKLADMIQHFSRSTKVSEYNLISLNELLETIYQKLKKN